MIFIPIVNGSEDKQFYHFPFDSSFPLISFHFSSNHFGNKLPGGISPKRPLWPKEVNKYRKYHYPKLSLIYFIYIKIFKYIYTPFLEFGFLNHFSYFCFGECWSGDHQFTAAPLTHNPPLNHLMKWSHDQNAGLRKILHHIAPQLTLLHGPCRCNSHNFLPIDFHEFLPLHNNLPTTPLKSKPIS